VKPNRFAYHDPATIDECVALLAEHGEDAKPLAGGQSLVPLMNLRLSAPAVLVDLNGVDDLAYVSDDGSTLAVGAMTRHRTIAGDDAVRAANPLLAHAATLIGYPAIRVRGTIGGSLSHADPVSEMPCVAVALGAELVIAGPAGRRTLPAGDFFQGYFTTAMEPGEMLVEVRFPNLGGDTGWGFAELARKAGDYAVVAVAAAVTVRDGTISSARIGLAGVADRPVSATTAEAALHGQPATSESVAAAAAAISAEVTANATRDLRFASHVAGVLGRRALTDALDRAGSPTP
jgi:carbon-monoxide dehydrogenase medium subunit